jgi:hypothetical protein
MMVGTAKLSFNQLLSDTWLGASRTMIDEQAEPDLAFVGIVPFV